MTTIIRGGTLVDDGSSRRADIVVADGHIADIQPEGTHPGTSFSEEIDASGCLVIPGVIDSHVHFREPGLTHKADIASESRAAAAGGVTTWFDMPNCVPQTTTLEALADKQRRAALTSVVNYAFFFGATNDNAALLGALDTTTVPGIKLFMGSSTGNMLVDRREAIETVFAQAAATRLPVVAHCEDTAIINRNMAAAKQRWGDDPDVAHHADIRSREACMASTQLAVRLATAAGARLHVAHLSTADELKLIDGRNVTAELCAAYLVFDDTDYRHLGPLVKVNPAIKSRADRDALLRFLNAPDDGPGHMLTVATDHAPHLLREKQGGAARAVSGMPLVQFSLPLMLTLTDRGVLTRERVVQLMCNNPARYFGVRHRGFLRPGYHADIAIVRRQTWTLQAGHILSRCGWSPLTGRSFGWTVERTICNGVTVYDHGRLTAVSAAQAVGFNPSR
ncbi:MAG: amidohydrolase family protein [Prevotella sp.]|nr:amidohydrolase family protein [Prevotella sp.]